MADTPTKASGGGGGESPLAHVAYFAGETALPGSSQVLKGDIASGISYGLVGLAAMMAFGPIGRVLVGGASYAKSVAGKDIVAALKGQGS